MSYKYNCNKRCDYIKKGLKKERVVDSKKRRQNCPSKDWETIKFDKSWW